MQIQISTNTGILLEEMGVKVLKTPKSLKLRVKLLQGNQINKNSAHGI
jgi:hypothetical protein